MEKSRGKPEALAEPTKITFDEVSAKLAKASQPWRSLKRAASAGELQEATLANNNKMEALDDLEVMSVDVGGLNKGNPDAEKNRRKLESAVIRVTMARDGKPVPPEDLKRSLELLEGMGVDVSKITFSTPQAGEVEASDTSDMRTSFERDLDGGLRMAGDNPNATRRAVEIWMQRNADNADKIPPGVIDRAQKILTNVNLLIQQQRNAQRLAQTAGTSAFGKTPEEMAAMGVEERATRKDPIIVELERPIRGHKIPFEYGGMAFMGGLRAERRAVEADESFLGERVKLLLSPIWSESLRIYNGEVTGETKADFSTLSTIESLLRTRIGEIQKTLADARKGGKPGEAQKLYFASLISSEEVDLGVGDITEKMLKDGFVGLTGEQVARIPEIKALKEMKQILSWHEAQLQLLRTLQAMRSYSAGKKIDSISALGEQAERPLLPTNAVIRIWGLEQLEDTSEVQTPEDVEARMVAKYTEDAMRIYSLIADVSREWPTFTAEGKVSFKAGSKVDMGLKRLIWKHLLVKDLVTEGTVPLDVKFVLNRFGQGLNSERLATVEAFVEHLVTSGAMDALAKMEKAGETASFDGLIAELGVGLSGSINKAVENAKEEMLGEAKIKMVPEAELTPREKEIQLGCANAVATIHVTGLADKLAKYYAWTVPVEKTEEKVKKAKDKGKVIWADEEKPRIPMVKVGGYPACTAASELMNWTAKLEADRDIGLPIGPATLEDAMKMGILPPSLAKTFLEYTTLNEAGKVTSLWDYWESQELPIYKLTKMMADKLGPNTHGAWLTSLKSSNKLRSLLTSTDKEPLTNMYNNDALLGDISSALYFGLGPPSTDERKLSDAKVRGVIYAGTLAYNTGLTGQLSSAEVAKRLTELRGGTPTSTRELEFFIAKLIYDSLDVPQKEIKPKSGAVSSAGFIVFRDLMERHFKAMTRGRSLTTGGLQPAVIVNQPGGVPYAKIWNNPLQADGSPMKYSVGGVVYSLSPTL